MRALVDDAYKSYGQKKVLQGVSFEIPSGSSLVVIGGSGNGKSVLMRCMIGLEKADKGRIVIDDVEVNGTKGNVYAALMRRIGVLFQAGALFDSLPVWKNVAFSAIHHDGASKKEALALAQATLEEVGLGKEALFLSPAELSGGMQKRVALARAVASKPELIFFDEPTTGLDPIMSEVINGLIVNCRKKLGATTFTITHDMHSAKTIADRVAWLHDGVIKWHGAPDELKNAQDPYLQSFLSGAGGA
ncbi:MAG: ATP-binding cassette domain-containing protein [Rickettsiales bacterium]